MLGSYLIGGWFYGYPRGVQKIFWSSKDYGIMIASYRENILYKS